MLTASPITNQPVGKTFSVAISTLGVGAVLQVALIGWALLNHTPVRVETANPIPATTAVAHTTTLPTTAESRTAELNLNTFAEPPQTQTTPATPAAPPKPTPVSAKPPEAQPANRFEEIVLQGKELRDRGDMNAAITKFREAGSMDGRSPIPVAELAQTYEKMGLADKAGENWRKVYEMGEGAGGIYYSLAEAKLKATQAITMKNLGTQSGSAPENTADLPAAGAVHAGAILGLLQITSEEQRDDNSAKRFILHIPIQARPKVHVDVRDLVIHVLFYDIVDGQNVVQTSANVNSRWATPPADWVDSDTEELAVEYQLPKPEARAAKRENRKYFGYIVRIYYKQQLQSATAEPERLAQQYPPPPTLPKESDK